MALREKTILKFKEYFEKESLKNQGREIELSFSQVQRETGATIGTMKRALDNLQAEGWLEVKPGRSSRWGIFRLVNPAINKESTEEKSNSEEKAPNEEILSIEEKSLLDPVENSSVDVSQGDEESQEGFLSDKKLFERIHEIENMVEGLRRRARTQEMTIALLQDRLAEIEDKLYKK